jgi:hypothetical protein
MKHNLFRLSDKTDILIGFTPTSFGRAATGGLLLLG